VQRRHDQQPHGDLAVARAGAGRPGGMPVAGVVPQPQHRQAPLWFHRARVQMQDGAVLAAVQAEDQDLDAVKLGQRDGRAGAALTRCQARVSSRPRQYAEPPFRQVTRRRRGHARYVHPRVQRAELTGHRAQRGQRADGLQGLDDVVQVLSGVGEQSRPYPGPSAAQKPCGEPVQQVLAGGQTGPGHRHVRRRRRVEVDARGGLGRTGGQVQPAEAGRRVRAQPELAAPLSAVAVSGRAPAAEVQRVSMARLVSRGEPVQQRHARQVRPGRGGGGTGMQSGHHREPGARRGLHVGQEVQLTVAFGGSNRDRHPDRDQTVRPPELSRRPVLG
jgi:hypothetical protein